MTNNQIMMAYKVQNGIPLDTPLLTYGAWRARGYMVKRGERSAHKVTLYKYKRTRQEQEDGTTQESGRMFAQVCSLFLPNQVEKI